MNAQEARALYLKVSKIPSLEEFFNEAIKDTIKDMETNVSVSTPYHNTVENKSLIKGWLTDRGFKDIKVERERVSGGNDPNHPHPTFYNLHVSFSF